ncbi:hypothetical protein ACM0BA_25265, partial [Mycobacteroides abscessus subsp. abscessus]
MNAASPDPHSGQELGDEREPGAAASHSASPADSAGSADASGLGSDLPANGIDPSTFLQPVQ